MTGTVSMRLAREWENEQIANMVNYIQGQELYYGTDRRRPSWGLPFGTHVLPATVADSIIDGVSAVVSEFVAGAVAHFGQAFLLRPNGEAAALRFGVPQEVVSLWQQALKEKCCQLPFCVRPDILVDEEGQIKIVEFNVDARLDRGIAVGVTDYSRYVKEDGNEFLADLLDTAYARSAVELSGRLSPRIVIAVSEAVRAEYTFQEEYFARRLRLQGVDCRVRTVPQLTIDASGQVIDLIDRQSFDVVVPEVELFDADGRLRLPDITFLLRLLKAEVHILGSCLPFADKVLLALLRGHCSSGAAALASTWLLRRESAPGALVHHDCSEYDRHYVLKSCGLGLSSTGSKEVVVCSDIPGRVWRSAVSEALSDVDSERRAWIWQPRLESARYTIRYRLKPHGATRTSRCLVRLSAYYVRDTTRPIGASIPKYRLAAALATAGTDEETLKRGKYNVHGLRQSTYLAVTACREKVAINAKAS